MTLTVPAWGNLLCRCWNRVANFQLLHSWVYFFIGPEARRAKDGSLRAQKGGVLGKGCSPPNQLEGLGSAAISHSGVRGEAPMIWRFGTFHGLRKRLYVPESRHFYLPHLYLAPPLELTPLDFSHEKLNFQGCLAALIAW